MATSATGEGPEEAARRQNGGCLNAWLILVATVLLIIGLTTALFGLSMVRPVPYDSERTIVEVRYQPFFTIAAAFFLLAWGLAMRRWWAPTWLVIVLVTTPLVVILVALYASQVNP